MRYTKFLSIAGVLGLALALGLAPIAVSSAHAEFGTAKERTAKKEVTGDLVAKTGRTLSIETSRTGGDIREMLIPVNPATVKLERIKSLADIQPGDKLRVQCEYTYRENEQGEEQLAGMTATKVTWLSRSVANTGGLRSEVGSAAQ